LRVGGCEELPVDEARDQDETHGHSTEDQTTPSSSVGGIGPLVLFHLHLGGLALPDATRLSNDAKMFQMLSTDAVNGADADADALSLYPQFSINPPAHKHFCYEIVISLFTIIVC